MPLRSQDLRIVLILVVAGLALGGLESGLAFLHRHHTIQELRALRDRVYQARAAAEACRDDLASAQQLFRRYDAVVDSLRREVRHLEELDPKGIPETRYDEYLQKLKIYNDAVASWHLKSDSLEDREATCRDLAEAHDRLTDSLKYRLTQVGIPAG